jgi:hypothetical protein
MTLEHLTQEVMENSKDIAVLKESDKAMSQRMDVMERVVDGIHKLAANMEALIVQVRALGETVEQSNINMENRIKEQTAATEERFKSHGVRLGVLEEKPGKRYDGIVDKAITAVVAGLIGVLLTRVIGM